jgi:3-oxoacyl-(acyl-carrier-protein) synthase/malonyl CoA-acyl carrier protein transacylase/phosphopantetheinyl transferase
MAEIAIVGMAVLLPGAPDLETYWQNVVDGVDAITEVPAHRWDPSFYDPAAGTDRLDRVYCRRGGFVDGFAEVAAGRFGIMPNSVAGIEPDQLLALQVAAAAIADAGGAERLPAGDRVGVVIGRGGYLTPGMVRLDQRVRTANQLVHTLRELLPGLTPAQLDGVRDAFADQLGPAAPESAIGLVPNLAASRIANRLDLRGPAYTVDAACASSLVAVDHAVTELTTGRCDAVLAGGVHHCHDITLWSVFAQLRALSRQERIRPFDRRADGILIGEGTGVVVLKRLSDAVRDEDRVYAVIRGTGVASDGRSGSLFNPEPAGQVRAVRRAWEAAGLDPAAPGSIGLLEAHGTGTPTGDLAELATVSEVFGAGYPSAVIGSVKSMIGHTMPAAGVAGLVKAALAIHSAVLPPTLNCEEPRLELSRTRFRPIAVAQPWESPSGPRRAGVNAFGFGGINAHVVLEEARPSARRARPVTVTESEQVLRLAAPDHAALAALLDVDDATLRAAGRTSPAPVPAGCRLGIVAPTAKRLALARRIAAKGVAWRGRSDVWFSPAPLLPAGRLAYVFPGLEADFAPRVADVAARLGVSITDVDVANVGSQGAGVVAVGRLLERALRRMGIAPDSVAGHSVGEWTAMISAGLYSGAAVDEFLTSFDPDSVRVPGLVFAAIGAGADRVSAAIADRPGVLLSHDNAPSQSIVCGPPEEIEDLVGWFRRNRVLCQTLPFRSGFHTPMLAPYLEPIRAAAARFELYPPAVPVWSATTASPFPADPAAVRALFLRHLLEPVRFRPMIEAMYAAGVRVFLQVGPGQLASVIGDVLHGRDYLAIPANVAHHTGLAQLRRVASALWVEGASPDTTFVDGRDRLVRLDLGGSLVSLGDRARELRPAEPAETYAGLHQLSARVPAAGELAELLQETAETAVALLSAPSRGAFPIGEHRSALPVSVHTMPYLHDHCFFRQRHDWPDDTDRWPVIPATTVVQHMIDAAERAAPGLRAVAVHGARFNRWVVAAPPVDVPVTVTGDGTHRIAVAFGSYSQAVIELATGAAPAPAPWRPDPAGERAPQIVAEQLYTDRWMFHGPLFQGVTRLLGISDAGVRGVLTTPPAPGALLDNVGQLLGYWIMATQATRRVVFPVGMGRISFFGPHPAAGTPLECVIRIRSVTDAQLTADAQLVADGRVWCEIEDWVDRRFDSHPDTHAVERFADRNTLSKQQPGEWTLVYERWLDLASRDLIMRTYLGAGERAHYERCAPRTRRQWLLGRIAVKDAVRAHLWQREAGPLFPAEISVTNDDSGRPAVTGLHGRDLPDLDVSIAHRAEVGVSIARLRSGPHGVGIDVEEIVERPAATRELALSKPEEALLATLVADTGEPQRLWFTRFWAAKEAVGKALGTGLDGRPWRFAVTAASGSELRVEVAEVSRIFRVAHTQVCNPPDLPAREYVVAWTDGYIEGEAR